MSQRPSKPEKLVRVLDDFEPAPLPVNLLYTAGRFLLVKVLPFSTSPRRD
jgi:hypothetical protein